MKLENDMVRLFDDLIVMPSNRGLAILAGVIWAMVLLPYYNANFDLLTTIANYFVFFSVGSFIAVFLYPTNVGRRRVGGLAAISFVLSIVTLIAAKSVMLSTVGYFAVLPMNIFCVLLLLKNMWITVFAEIN